MACGVLPVLPGPIVKDYDETIEAGVLRATIELDLESGAHISLEIRGGESLIRVLEDLDGVEVMAFGAGRPVRSEGRKRLRVEVEGRMEKCKFTNLAAPRPT